MPPPGPNPTETTVSAVWWFMRVICANVTCYFSINLGGANIEGLKKNVR